MARVGLDVEFERCHERQDESEEELEHEKHVGGMRLDEAIVALRVVVLAIVRCAVLCLPCLFRTRCYWCYWWSEGVLRKCFRVGGRSCLAAMRSIDLHSTVTTCDLRFGHLDANISYQRHII